MTNREIINYILKEFKDLDYVMPEDIPNIDLYVDQVTTFMDTHLSHTKRSDDDKILTKTMINNYTKNNVLPSPDKKKYSKDHILSLIFIYYFKSFLSIGDISSILNPITDEYFNNQDGKNFSDVYQEIFSLQNEESKALIREIFQKYNRTKKAFSDAPEEDQEMLQKFALICSLSFDVYIKKMMIEKIIDNDLSPKSDETDSKEA